MRGRHSYAILKKLGIEDTIGSNVDEYIDIAVRLGRDHEWRDSLQNEIRKKKDRIFADKESIINLEQFLMAAVSSDEQPPFLEK